LKINVNPVFWNWFCRCWRWERKIARACV